LWTTKGRRVILCAVSPKGHSKKRIGKFSAGLKKKTPDLGGTGASGDQHKKGFSTGQVEVY
jgi:hypothetical protein